VPIVGVGPQSRSGHCGKEKKLAQLGIEPGPSNPEPVAVPTEPLHIETTYIVEKNTEAA
jgi:hypothetical protein